MHVYYAYFLYSFHAVHVHEMPCLGCSRTISDLPCMFHDLLYVVVMFVARIILLCCRLGCYIDTLKISH